MVQVLAHLLPDLHERVAAWEQPLRRLEHDGLDGEVLEGEVTPAVRRGRLLVHLAVRDLGLGALAELRELRLDLLQLGGTTAAGTLEGVEHRPKGQLDLRRIDGLGFLAEELALQPLQLEGDEQVELPELVPLVLGALGPELELVPLALDLRELLS